MTGRALVTFVVPVYNQSEYLRECLTSLTAQTFPDWQAVVVDDGSTRGNSHDVVKSLADARIRFMQHDRNRGLAAARNTGVREACGEYVVPVDADDRLAPTYLAEVLDAAQSSSDCDAVFTDILAFGVRGGRLPYDVRDVKALLVEQWIPGAGALFRRSLWEIAGGYCEADALRPGNEDWDFWLSVAEHGLRVRHVPQPLYLYRQHQDSMVLRLQSQDYLTREFIYDRHRALFDRYRMKNAFLSGGYFCSAKAHWRQQEMRLAVRLGTRSFLLAPLGCTRRVVKQSFGLLRQRRAPSEETGAP